ncbi:nitric oxide reductase activation protein NorD [uncultured Variovorax sp.]|uniref:nitric oxide reductase activation protein NorD n=1 Tax=uncultured Variovorax sp. TaxID=114708 RepID=UPI0026066CB5|nr:nitric oxide reductase activation protein NorD [uncultured Variovorax sp.]
MKRPEECSQAQSADRRLEALRNADRRTHEVLRDALPTLEAHLGPIGRWSEIFDSICQLSMEDTEAALTLAQRLRFEPSLVENLVAFRRWVLYGINLHSDSPKRSAWHFRVSSPSAFANEDVEGDAAHLLSRREALLHYLHGFDVNLKGIDIHEPEVLSHRQAVSTVNQDLLWMPRSVPGISGLERDLLYRATAAHVAAHLKFSPLSRPVGNRALTLVSLIALLEDARVERLMVREYPGLHGLWGRFHTATRETAGFHFTGLAARLARALHDPSYEDRNDWVVSGRRAFENLANRDLHDFLAFDAAARELTIQVNQMRQSVPSGYRPAPIYRDDNELLWDRRGATPIDESVEPKYEVVESGSERSKEGVDETVHNDVRRRFRYPEWDHRLDALREDWATVIESGPAAHRGAVNRFVQKQAQRVRGLEQTPDRSIRLNRLAEGDELDLTAAVDGAIQQRSRLAPDGRIFRRHGRRHRATAVVLLMDLSVSTRRFVPGSFTTVLEVEKRAARVVAQALDSGRDRVAVHGFASNGRHEVNYQRIKDFDEPFGAEQQARLAALQGSLSTRMGAALRHASAALDGQAVDHKVILMLTDGEPSDVDVVEDEHLVEDARHAVASAAARGIRTFCLTLDRQADVYVRRIFGSRNYLIADRADAFAGHTGDALVRLVAH